jgi:hypothetical protein
MSSGHAVSIKLERAGRSVNRTAADEAVGSLANTARESFTRVQQAVSKPHALAA